MAKATWFVLKCNNSQPRHAVSGLKSIFSSRNLHTQQTGTILTILKYLTHGHDRQRDQVVATIHRKNAPPPGDHVFQATGPIFKPVQDIIGTNLLTKSHDDWTINMASRVLTRKNAPPLCSHVILANVTISELIETILPTEFHEDWTINVASRVLTRKNAPPPAGHIFKATETIFELVQDIIGMHHLTKFHEDWTINVASRVLTRFYYSHTSKNAPPLGSHVFQANETIFELIQYIIETNLLTKFHEDWTINVASRVLTRQMLKPHNARRKTDKRRSH
ncbi:hypothetical protein DPMN_130196 [Dreissena polymorpha]|uniref:Uncharacterized protein n=1 Tax=Dreissena polymorpha TaxID=45954 RepID=A0A9D4K1M7_DREPO|nr:hypothetical protein DPMN_130196 [Dreissena polymorpha]